MSHMRLESYPCDTKGLGDEYFEPHEARQDDSGLMPTGRILPHPRVSLFTYTYLGLMIIYQSDSSRIVLKSIGVSIELTSYVASIMLHTAVWSSECHQQRDDRHDVSLKASRSRSNDGWLNDTVQFFLSHNTILLFRFIHRLSIFLSPVLLSLLLDRLRLVLFKMTRIDIVLLPLLAASYHYHSP